MRSRIVARPNGPASSLARASAAAYSASASSFAKTDRARSAARISQGSAFAGSSLRS